MTGQSCKILVKSNISKRNEWWRMAANHVKHKEKKKEMKWWRMPGQSEGNVPTFPKGFFFPKGPWCGFLWNCDCSIWQKGTNLELQRFSPNSNFKFPGNVLCKQLRVTRPSEFWWFRQYFPVCWFGSKLIEHSLFHHRIRNIPCSINRAPPSHNYNQQKSKHFKRKMRAAISKMITKVRSFVDKAGI